MYAQKSLVLDPVNPSIPSVVVPGRDADADAAAADDADDLVVFPLPPPSYPSFPKSQYSWYFRSNGATYVNGTLTVQIVRHLWNKATQEFVSTDRGTLVLTCQRNLIAIPLGPQVMQGTLTIGGSVSTIKATKTSTFYRGCRIEVDAMVNRNFPASATIGSGAVATLRSIYATAGWDVNVVTDAINIPNDASLTNAELATVAVDPTASRRPARPGGCGSSSARRRAGCSGSCSTTTPFPAKVPPVSPMRRSATVP